MTVQVLDSFYEGKAKTLFNTSDPTLIVQYFKDDATAFNRQKFGQIAGKGVVNLAITKALYKLLESKGVKTHLVDTLDERRMVSRRVEIVPLEVVVRNRVAGTFAKRYAVPEGTVLPAPIVEFFLKKDELGDPLITAEAAIAIGLATPQETQDLDRLARKVNEILKAFFLALNIELIDFKLEFGKLPDGTLLLADEISPDSCRFWEVGTGKKLDKDRFRQDLGGIEDAYAEMLRRVQSAT